jgi:hypothetical protein
MHKNPLFYPEVVLHAGILQYIFVSACLGYLYTRVFSLVIALELKVIYILFITCEIYLVLSCLDLVVVVHSVEPTLFRFCA